MKQQISEEDMEDCCKSASMREIIERLDRIEALLLDLTSARLQTSTSPQIVTENDDYAVAIIGGPEAIKALNRKRAAQNRRKKSPKERGVGRSL